MCEISIANAKRGVSDGRVQVVQPPDCFERPSRKLKSRSQALEAAERHDGQRSFSLGLPAEQAAGEAVV